MVSFYTRFAWTDINIFYRHFNGEEGFDTGIMAPISETPAMKL